MTFSSGPLGNFATQSPWFGTDWILATHLWNDHGIWIDTATWID